MSDFGPAEAEGEGQRPRRPAPLLARVWVEGRPPWAAWPEAEKAVTLLEAELGALMSAWALPIKARVGWRDGTGCGFDNVLKLSLDGGGPAVFVRVAPPAEASAEAVSHALAVAALGLRAAWLTPAVLRRLGIEARHGPLLQAGARRGLAPFRFDAGARAEDRMSAEEVCERVLDARPVGLRLQVADLQGPIGPGAGGAGWEGLFGMLETALFEELGLLIPAIGLEADERLPTGCMRLWINDLPLPVIPALAGAAGDEAGTPRPGHDLQAIAAALSRHGALVWGTTATEAVLVRQHTAPERQVEAWQSRYTTTLLHAVLIGLLSEQVSIRDLARVLDAMLALHDVAVVDSNGLMPVPPPTAHVLLRERGTVSPAAPPTAAEWIEQARNALRTALQFRYLEGDRIPAFLVGHRLERQLLDDPAQFAAAAGHERLIAAMLQAFGPLPSGKPRVVLVRRVVRAELLRLARADIPELVVLALDEVLPEVPVEVLGRIE